VHQEVKTPTPVIIGDDNSILSSDSSSTIINNEYQQLNDEESISSIEQSIVPAQAEDMLTKLKNEFNKHVKKLQNSHVRHNVQKAPLARDEIVTCNYCGVHKHHDKHHFIRSDGVTVVVNDCAHVYNIINQHTDGEYPDNYKAVILHQVQARIRCSSKRQTKISGGMLINFLKTRRAVDENVADFGTNIHRPRVASGEQFLWMGRELHEKLSEEDILVAFNMSDYIIAPIFPYLVHQMFLIPAVVQMSLHYAKEISQTVIARLVSTLVSSKMSNGNTYHSYFASQHIEAYFNSVGDYVTRALTLSHRVLDIKPNSLEVRAGFHSQGPARASSK